MYSFSPNYSHILFLCIALIVNSLNIVLAQSFSQQYDEVSEFSEGWAAVRKGDKWGIIDEKGKTIAPIQYRTARVVSLDCDVTGLLLNGDYCFVDDSQIRCYNRLYPFSDKGYAKVYNNGLYGFINKKGVEVLPVQYKDIKVFYTDGLAKIRGNNGKKGLINKDLEIVVPPIYYEVRKLSKANCIKVCLDKTTCGLVDKTGQFILPTKYTSIKDVESDNLVVVTKLIQEPNKFADQFFLLKEKKILPNIYEELNPIRLENTLNNQLLFTTKREDKYGLINEKGMTILPFEYDYIQRFIWHKGQLKVSRNGKIGVVDGLGRIIIPLEYDRLPDKKSTGLFGRNLFATCKKNGKYGIVDTAYQTVIPFEYESLQIYTPQKIMARKNGKMGVINVKGEVIVPFKFDKVKTSSRKDIYIVESKKAEKTICALIDSAQNMLVPFERNYQWIDSFENGKACIKQNGKYGFIDEKGKEVMSPKYDEAIEEWNILMEVIKDGKRGVIDSFENIIIEPIYDRISLLNNGGKEKLFRVSKNGKAGILKYNGETLIPPTKYEEIKVLSIYSSFGNSYGWGGEMFKNGYTVVVQNGKQGIIDSTGREILAPQLTYDYIFAFDRYGTTVVNQGAKKSFSMCSISPTLKGGKWGVINIKGEQILPLDYEMINRDKYGGDMLVAFKNNQQYSYNLQLQKLSVPYDRVNFFVQNVAIVEKDKQLGVLHKNQKEILKPQFDKVKYYEPRNKKETRTAKAILVEQNGKWGAISTKTGQIIIPPKYSDLKFVSDSRLAYNIGKVIDLCLKEEPKNGLWGLVDCNGNELTEAKYTTIRSFSNEVAIVNIDGKMGLNSDSRWTLSGGKWGAIDTTGKEIIPTKYCHSLTSFQNGYTVVITCPENGGREKHNKIIINTKGELIFPEKYAKFSAGYVSERFENQLIGGQKNDKWQLLNLSKGQPVGKHLYDEIWGIKCNIAKAIRNDSTYFVNAEGKEIVNVTEKYDKTDHFKHGLCKVYKNGKEGVIDTNGKELLKPEYESIKIDKKTGKVEAYKNGKEREFDFK